MKSTDSSTKFPALAHWLSLALLLGGALTSCEAPSSAGASRAEHYGPTNDRPGLATTLGHEVNDRFVSTQFYRKDEHHPDKVVSFHYSDNEGAKAMAELAGKPSRHSGSFDLADGCLRGALIRESYGDDDDDALPWYEAGGKVFVAGQPGYTYSIRLENRTRDRMEVVVSVDGLDVRGGTPASVSHPGYVIVPKGVLVIPGMKVGKVMKRFTFGSVRESQASKVGGEKGARNVGVIGVAMYFQDEDAARLARAKEGLEREGAQAFSAR